MYVTTQEFNDLVAATAAIGERLEKLEAAERRKMEERIYNGLPVSVQAEMIEEEFADAKSEMEEITG